MDPTTRSPETPVPIEAPPQTPWGALLFCLALVVVGCVFLGLAVKRRYFPDRSVPMGNYDVAAEARKYLRENKPAPLSEKLEEVLEEGKRVHFETKPHLLLGKVAPEFTREDVDGKPWALKEALRKGPVVVVFYLGYHCNHCVSQLFDLNEDIARFRELGAAVVALSPDSAATTRERYKEYGAFRFPVLSDHSKQIAEAYGVFTPAKDGAGEDMKHGTFILDRQGVVRWATFGDTPFGHNPTLIYELAKIQGRVK